jgi:2-polyprenyl-6-methoxyphenol hydroxylase-like FAD-dependent oxidoreductase
MDVPDPSAPETWTFQLIQSWLDSSQPATVDLSTPAGRMKFFKARAAEYAEPWRSAGAAVADDVNIPLDRGTYWDKSQKWDNRGGKMTLCGDAAHPMTPRKFPFPSLLLSLKLTPTDRGQGLNAALQDSSSFVSAMIAVRSGAQTLESAVQAYDDEVLERGQREMRISLQQSLNIHSWDTLMQSPMFKIGMKKAEAGDGEGGEVK